ncbi:MAG: hypothetical protein V9G29_11480 [Burkholderiaceae bacterium]
MSRPPFENPAQLLRQADRVLRAMQPATSTHFSADGISYRARFDYPGYVSVFDRNTGELVAQSLPGNPTKLVATSRLRRAAGAR